MRALSSLLAVALLFATPARAEEASPAQGEPAPAEEDDESRPEAEPEAKAGGRKPSPEAEPAAKAGARRGRPKWAGVPIIGGNSDFGWGGGALLSVTVPSTKRESKDAWNAELAAVAMLDWEEFEPRFQDYYLHVLFDDALGRGLRLAIRPSFTHVVGVNYYGLGNAAVRGGPSRPNPDGFGRSYYDYTHADATLRLTASHDFSRQVRLSAGVIWSYVWMEVPAESRLAEDLNSGTEEVRSMLAGTDDHAFSAFVWSLELDSRDEEVNPHRGLYQTTSFTFAPGGVGPFTDTWLRMFLALRGFQGLFDDRVVLAGRILFDVLGGTPPVYELSRFDNFSNAFGGEKGVRGIEAQRYYGKAKVLANFEARISLFDFRLIGKQTLMLTPFFDVGRLWAEFGASEELDGAGLGLKYSMGAGLRLLFEDSFVVAFDAGWSPDAQPLGVYLTSGHAF